MPRITLVNRQGLSVDVDAVSGRSLMESIRNVDGSVEAICGGMCSCATCHVYVAGDWRSRLPPRSYEETFMLRDQSTFDEASSRLSCQIMMQDAYDGLTVTVAPEE